MATFLGMRHIAIAVRDVEKSAAFYENAFGMMPFGPTKRGGAVMPLVSPRLRDQITLVSETNQGEAGRPLGKPGEQGGIDHFGFVLSPGSNLDHVRRKLERAGGTFLKRVDIAEGIPSLFFTDPDGYVIQLTRFPRFTRLYIAYSKYWIALRRIFRANQSARPQ